MNSIGVVFLIRSLDIGGAERQLVTLARGMKARGVRVVVATFYGQGALCAELHAAGVPHYSLGKRGRWDVFGFFLRVLRLLRRERPTVLYSFLTTSNLVAAIASVFIPSMRIAWGVRASKIDSRLYGRLVMFEERAVRWVSRAADVVIFNSVAGQDYYRQLGVVCHQAHVISNGIDTERFRFVVEERSRLRETLGISDTVPLIGIVARLDPIKGHDDFLRMAVILSNSYPHLRYVCIGGGSPDYTSHLRKLPDATALGSRVIWLGEQDDPRPAYSSIDIFVSTSKSEAFSNVIAEAMACECLCVVTDVGDSSRIVGECGVVIPRADPVSAASACAQLLKLTQTERRSRGFNSRRRVIENFDVNRFVDDTIRVLDLQDHSA